MIGNNGFFLIRVFYQETLHIKQFFFAFPINGAQRFFWIPLFKNYHIVIKTKLNIGDYRFNNAALLHDEQPILFSELTQKFAAFVHIQSLYRIVKPYFTRL